MKERGIIMSGDNPRLILEGRKTQTRRIMKPQPWQERGLWFWHKGDYRAGNATQDSLKGWLINRCPHGAPGDRLWVRETFALEPKSYAGDKVVYRADGKPSSMTWRPSIHMPRWASRITLEILKVRVERLQEIGFKDAIAEGIKSPFHPTLRVWKDQNELEEWRMVTINAYRDLWDLLHGKGEWDKNPWVWVIEFKKL